MKFKRILMQSLFLAMASLIVACSDSSDGEEEILQEGYAPASMERQRIIFYKNGIWNFYAYVANGKTIVIPNADAGIYSSSGSYKKTGANEAQYSMEFTYTETGTSGNPNFAPEDYSGHVSYSLNLKFISTDQGNYSGTKNNKEHISGIFRITKDLTTPPDELFKEENKDDVTVSSCSVTTVTLTSVTVSGSIKLKDNSKLTERGFCYAKQSKPTVNNGIKKEVEKNTGSASVTINGLESDITYYICQYIIYDGKTIYGDISSFKTKANDATVTLSRCSVIDIKANSIKVSGDVKIEGNAVLTERGFCYNTQENPTLEYGTKINMGQDKGIISTTLDGLKSSTNYYIRQYVIYNKKTIYGDVSTFRTEKENENPDNPDDEDNTDYSIQPILQRVYSTQIQIAGKYTIYVSPDEYKIVGFCASTSPHPTITDIVLPEAYLGNTPSGRVMDNLQAGTTYYVRPFYKSGNKIIYCKETSFQTVGSDIQLSVKATPEKDKIIINSKITRKGTYHLKLSYDSIITTNPGVVNHPDLGYLSEGNKTFEQDVKYLWSSIYFIRAELEDIETNIIYCSESLRGGREPH